MRPVLEGLIQYESLYRTELALYDIAKMNDALNIKAENARRVNEFEEKKPRPRR